MILSQKCNSAVDVIFIHSVKLSLETLLLLATDAFLRTLTLTLFVEEMVNNASTDTPLLLPQ